MIENVWDYPRPPRLEAISDRLTVKRGDVVLADASGGFRILETSHPPTYYLPPDAVNFGALEKLSGETLCEWKGRATYWGLRNGKRSGARAAWAYPNPTRPMADIKDHVAFYCTHEVDCFVAGEQAKPQDGDFYGGWVTSWISGDMKGRPGTLHW